MQADKAKLILKEMAAKVSPDPTETFDSAASVIPDKVAYTALKQGIAAIEGNQEAVDLGDLMARQRKLMNVLGIAKGPVPDILFSPVYKDVLIMMGGEVHEALEPLTLGTKPWKIADSGELRAHALEELVDVFFFMLEAFELAGLSAKDVEKLYEEKRQRNFVRASGKSQGVLDAAAAAVTPAAEPDIEHAQVLSAMQRAAGMATSVRARSALWQAVWDAEAHESTLRAGSKSTLRVITLLIETLRGLPSTFSKEDLVVVKNCLIDEIGLPTTKLILEKAGWVDENQA